MSTYKVLQDIEAEDKLLGPLTLRQFVYAGIVAASGFMIYKAASANWLLALPLLPHTIFFAVLAAPFGHDQSNEVWLLAKIRFSLKPRKRIWDQSGIKELVTITAPKKIERVLTNGLSQTEVKSRLQALASTIDSHGWSAKDVNVFNQPAYSVESDRLINPSMPAQDTNYDDAGAHDILDEQNNPRVQNIDKLMAQSAQTRREKIVTKLQQTAAEPAANIKAQGPWFTNQVPQAPTPGVIKPGQAGKSVDDSMTADEQALLEQLHAKKRKKKSKSSSGPTPSYSHMRMIKPISDEEEPEAAPVVLTPPASTTTEPLPVPAPAAAPATPVTPPANPAIIELANNDDLNVATIARQANKRQEKEPPQNEVVVSLH